MATGIRGNDCPVPKGGLFGSISAAEHDAWCDCMFTGNNDLLTKCKLKATIDPATWKYIALPWTEAGKASRELPDAGALGTVLNQGIDYLGQTAGDLAAGKEVTLPGGVALPTGSNQPAGTGGPLSTSSGGASVGAGTRFSVTLPMDARTGRIVSRVLPDVLNTGGVTPPSNVYRQPEESSTTTLLVVAGVAVAAVLLMRPKRSMGGFGGYSRRAKRRR